MIIKSFWAMKNIRSKRAFALSIVLWISAALMAVALYSITVTKQSVQNAKLLDAKLRSKLDVESAFEKVLFYLSSSRFWENSASNELEGMPKKIYLDNRVSYFMLNDSNITLKVQDIGGIMNVTILGQKLMVTQRLIKLLTGKESLYFRDSYLDWLDPDEKRYLNGAESFYYHSKHRVYGSANNRYIEHPDELRLIRGFDTLSDEEWKRLRKYFAYSYSGSRNLMAFPDVMIKAFLDLTSDEWEELMAIKKKNIEKYRDKFLSHIADDEQRERMYFHPTRSFVIKLKADNKGTVSRITATADLKPKVETMINIIEFRNK